MKISFLGAAETVTGSNFLVQTESGVKFLVDCGLIQGKDVEEEKNFDDFLYSPKDIDFMLLTHAHIDHSGRIPKLYNEGFRGKVYTTQATIDLCEIMLADSGYIQEAEAKYKTKKRKREGRGKIEPLYTAEDATNSMELFSSIEYNEIVDITDDIKVRYTDAGHMLGSAIIEIWIIEDKKTKKIVFTGDIGSGKISLLDDPSFVKTTDYLVMESTYGDRKHIDVENKAERFLEIVSRTLKRNGNVIIPSFAVGRTQEVLYEINKIKDSKHSKEFEEQFRELMNARVYVDSPLAISATEVFRQNMQLFGDEVQNYISSGDNPLEFKGLNFTLTADESKELNEKEPPMIIISASGMCEVGRIRHHLKHNLWDPKNTILFVGYQAAGTLGRTIVDGAKKVKLFGEEIAVNAEVEYIEGYSGHADQDFLMEFVNKFEEKPKNIFLVHGEKHSQKALKKLIQEKEKIPVIIPKFGESYVIKDGIDKQHETEHLRLKRKKLDKIDLVGELEDLSTDIEALIKELKDNLDNDDITDREKQEILDKINMFKDDIKKM